MKKETKQAIQTTDLKTPHTLRIEPSRVLVDDKGSNTSIKVIAVFDNMQETDVTKEASFTSSNEDVVKVDGGKAEIGNHGTASVRVEYQGRYGNVEFIVPDSVGGHTSPTPRVPGGKVSDEDKGDVVKSENNPSVKEDGKSKQ